MNKYLPVFIIALILDFAGANAQVTKNQSINVEPIEFAQCKSIAKNIKARFGRKISTILIKIIKINLGDVENPQDEADGKGYDLQGKACKISFSDRVEEGADSLDDIVPERYELRPFFASDYTIGAISGIAGPYIMCLFQKDMIGGENYGPGDVALYKNEIKCFKTPAIFKPSNK